MTKESLKKSIKECEERVNNAQNELDFFTREGNKEKIKELKDLIDLNLDAINIFKEMLALLK